MDAGDLGQALKVLADREDHLLNPPAELVTALVAGESYRMSAGLLWRLTHLACPALVYDLDNRFGRPAETLTWDRWVRLWQAPLPSCRPVVVLAQHPQDGGRGGVATLLTLGDDEAGGDVAQAEILRAGAGPWTAWRHR
ncbi:hypothetical protein [Nonomuraea sp. NPDC005692]|uniref:hypothetical protein n=1 Tax=Nonomuraea sp. NPDC005692 TaxID=3157168 RepID=UPI0033D6F9D3